MSDESLYTSDQMLIHLMSHIDDVVYFKDLDSRFIQVNKAFAERLNCKPEDVVGKTDFDIFASEHARQAFEDEQQILRTGEPLLKRDEKETWPDGRITWVSTTKMPLHDSTGKVVGTCGISRDITERKNAEKRVRFEQGLFNSLMELLPVSVYFKDRESRFVSANPLSAPRIGAKNAAEMIGKTDFDFFPEDGARERYELEQQIMRTGQPIQLEESGFGRWVLTTKAPWYDEDGNVAGTLGISSDITDRKTVNQDLEASRRLLRTVIDTMPGRVWWKDLDSKFMGCNVNFAHDAGLEKPDDLIGKTDYDMCWKEQADRFVADDREVIKTGKPKLNIHEHQTQPDGSTRWIKTNKIPLHNMNGEIIGTIGTYSDITDLKKLQEALEKRVLALTRPLDCQQNISFEELFNIDELQRIQDEFANATGVASVITNPDGTPITRPTNHSVLCRDIIRKTEKGCANCIKSDATIGRYNPDGPIIQPCLSGGLWDAGVAIEIAGHHIASWMIGQIRDETQTDENMLAYAREIGADEKEFLDAFHRIPKMSRQHFEEIAKALFSFANQLSMSAYQNLQQARFIAAEKRRTEELRLLSKAMEQSPETVLITNPEGIIEYANPAFEITSGFSREEVIGQHVRFLKSGMQDDAFYTDLWETISNGHTWEGRFTNKRKDGSLYTEEATIAPVRDHNGAIVNYVAVKRDITEELAREEQFFQSQKMESVGQLAGGIAHDFNNMLQAIRGFSEVLFLQLPEGSSQQNCVREIQKAAERAAELTRNLLVFSRKQPAKKKQMDLNHTVRDTEILLKTLLRDTITSELELADDLFPIYADHNQMAQIIMNLTVNARDAMPDGGQLTITTKNVTLSKKDAAELPDVDPGSYVCLAVTDTGCGMSPQVKEHLFEPFFTTKEVGKGTGLGLSVIYGIVKNHNGWMHVESAEDQGTTMQMFLPADVNNGQDNTDEPDAEGAHILFVEDEMDVLRAVKDILSRSGYTVTTATNAEEAQELFDNSSHPFDLLFSDITLPRKNGLDLADRLAVKSPDLPILLCSDYRDARSRWENIDNKGYHFLQKPFTVASLLHAVHKAMDAVKE